MSEEPSTTTTTTEEAETPTPTVDDAAIFLEIYDCAKNREQWNKVSSAISNHPEWLTRIPQGRRWTILHQVVYWGNVPHLNEVLGFQISNENFRFLFKALDERTVREVAVERGHLHPQMLQRVERLVASDQLLSNAKDGKWELVKQFLRQQPEIVNEKPPYKKYYLAHFLASTGQLDMFKELSEICHFKLKLIAENKTVSQTARENNHIEFAEHIENLVTTQDETNETNDDQSTSMDDESLPHVGPGFYDNPGIILLPLNSNSISTILSSPDDPGPYPDTDTFLQNLAFATHSLLQNHNTTFSPMFATHNLLHSHNLTTMPVSGTNLQNAIEEDDDDETEEETKLESKPKTTTKMTDEELIIYEKNIMENIKSFPSEIILGTITCSITKGIFRDPVMASDGFTYEREAIENWLQKSNRSPMTNQELSNADLTPNRSIKSLLQQLSISKNGENQTKSEENPLENGENSLENGENSLENEEDPLENEENPLENGENPLENGKNPSKIEEDPSVPMDESDAT